MPAPKRSDDPTVASTPAKRGASTDNVAPPSSEASDYAGDKVYKDAPADMKPGPDSVVQVEVRPDEDDS
jgi:hypothetical protein